MAGKSVALIAFVLVQGLAQPGLAQGGASGVDLVLGAPRHVQACTLVARDSVTLNFVCRTNGGLRQYWVTRSTHFVGGNPDASVFDLATGQQVQVTFHNAGRLAIADVVSF